jgi:hypothetical protein
MNTNQIGKITELDVLSYVIKKGYSVSIPYGDKDRYDQIWDIKGKLLRVQVKTCHPIDEACTGIIFNCRTTSLRSKGCRTLHYTSDEIDYFATIWDGIVYMVPVTECSDKKKLRFSCKQAQPNVSLAKNYIFDEVINKL